MEADLILKMVEDAFRHCYFIIYVIVNNDDSNMQALLKNPSWGAWVQVIKSSKGKIDEEVPVPYFFAYPSHIMKFFVKHIFSIVDYGKDQWCGCTKAHALRIKKDWEYMLNNNRKTF